MNWSDWVVTVAAAIAILDYFGIKPKESGWGLHMPTSRKWKFAAMLSLVALSLGMSAHSAYRSSHPKILEKIIEKPIETLVPAACPELQVKNPEKPAKPKTQMQPQIAPPPTQINASNGIAIGGGTVNNPTVNNYEPPARGFTQAQHDAIASFIRNSGIHLIATRAPNTGDGEAQIYSDKITAAIQDGGWKINPRPKFLIWQRHVIGLWILTDDTTGPCAVSLQAALKSAAIDAEFMQDKSTFSNGNEPCELIVGSQH